MGLQHSVYVVQNTFGSYSIGPEEHIASLPVRRFLGFFFSHYSRLGKGLKFFKSEEPQEFSLCNPSFDSSSQGLPNVPPVEVRHVRSNFFLRDQQLPLTRFEL